MIAVRTGGPRAVSRYAAVATLGLGVLAWIVAVQEMAGMDMGPATRLGSLPFFLGLWIPMMAAMMLPGAVPAVVRLASAEARFRAVPQPSRPTSATAATRTLGPVSGSGCAVSAPPQG